MDDYPTFAKSEVFRMYIYASQFDNLFQTLFFVIFGASEIWSTEMGMNGAMLLFFILRMLR